MVLSSCSKALSMSSDIVQLSLNSSIALLSPPSFHSLLSEPDDVIPVLSDTTPPDSTDISSQSITLQSSINHMRSRRSPNGTKKIMLPTVLNANLRGAFCQKLDELQVTLNQCNIDIAFLTETWLHPGITTDLTHIPNYTIHRKDRADGRSGGGVVIYVRSNWSAVPMSVLITLTVKLIGYYCVMLVCHAESHICY